MPTHHRSSMTSVCMKPPLQKLTLKERNTSEKVVQLAANNQPTTSKVKIAHRLIPFSAQLLAVVSLLSMVVVCNSTNEMQKFHLICIFKRIKTFLDLLGELEISQNDQKDNRKRYYAHKLSAATHNVTMHL